MKIIENGDTLIDVKKRIADILSKNNIATSTYSFKTTSVLPNNIITPRYNKQQPIPIDKEIKLDPFRTTISKTDINGAIEYANDYFMEICGYQENELLGQLYNIFLHPDMPKLIFNKIRERLKKGKNIIVLVKNMAKDGSYYWVLTKFETIFDKTGNVIFHYTKGKAIPENAAYQIEKIYKTLKSIEDNRSLESADKYFYNLLEDKNTSYDNFILGILGFDKKGIQDFFIEKNQKENTNKKRYIFNRLFVKQNYKKEQV